MSPQPAVKWTGSKRSQAEAITKLFPKTFGRYFEPFLGGGSVLYALAPEEAVCGDICEPLIRLWQRIREDPAGLAEAYRIRWESLQKDPGAYYRIRERFNRSGEPEDLLFLSRTCVNGLIRFNRKGEFNSPLHLGRLGIRPGRLGPILADWSVKIKNTRFLAGDYAETLSGAEAGDLVYLDPPYAGSEGMYYGNIDMDRLFALLEDLSRRGVFWALSLDGRRGDRNYRAEIPEGLSVRREELPSGNSPFRKVRAGKAEPVFESLYLNY